MTETIYTILFKTAAETLRTIATLILFVARHEEAEPFQTLMERCADIAARANNAAGQKNGLGGHSVHFRNLRERL